MKTNHFLTEFTDKASLELIDYYRTNFPKIWKLFRECEIEFTIMVTIVDDFSSVCLRNFQSDITYEFVHDSEHGDCFNYYDLTNKKNCFEYEIDLNLGFEYFDSELSKIVKERLFQKKQFNSKKP